MTLWRMNTEFKPLLLRQLHELGLDAEHLPDIDSWRSLLSIIEQTYHEARCVTGRSLAVPSTEMQYPHPRGTDEARLRTLFNTIKDLVWLKAPDGVYLACNPVVERMLGTAEAAIVGRTDYDFISREQADSFREHDRAAMNTGTVCINEGWLTFKDTGYCGLFETSKTPVYDDTGQLIGVFGIARDITERKRAEAALKNSEQQARNLIDKLQVGVLLQSARAEILLCNQIALDLLGLSEAQLLGKSSFDPDWNVIHEDGSPFPGSEHPVPVSIATKSLVHDVVMGVYRPSKRDRVWLLVSAAPQLNPNNEVEQVVCTFVDITERKKMEERLELTQFASDYAPDCILWVNEQARICYANEAALHCHGFSKEELLSMTIHDLDPDFPPDVWLAHWHELQHKGGITIETRHRRRDGSIFPIEVSANFVKFGDKEYNIAYHRDITERKKSEAALRYSEQRLRDVSEASGEYLWEIDINLGYTYVSNRSIEVKGYTPEQLLGHAPAEFMPPEDIDMAARIVNLAISKNQPFKLQHRDITPSGAILWEEVSGVPFYDDAGHLLGLRGTGRNITGRKLKEEQLRVAAAAFETHEAIMITDAHGTIIKVNQAFQRITGYSQEEVLGENPRILSAGRNEKSFYSAMWQQLTTLGRWRGEIWDKRKSGQIYPKWMTITAVRDENGKTTEYVAIFSDITQRKLAEEEIRNLAFYDALTRLPNRRLLLDRLHAALSVSARSRRFGAVLFLDMDRFKTLNDTMGHDYGDLLLIEVAERIKLCVREIDTVARLGGDEFVILVEEIDTRAEETSKHIAAIAEKIRSALSVPYRLKEKHHHSSPSIGVCLYRGIEESTDDLLKHADMAMYQAKDSGRNAVRFFDPLMQQAVEARVTLENDLRHALPNDQLQLYYQIQVDNDRRAIGAEALVRWIHPIRGMVSPAHFIPIAEETSLILEVGAWVLKTACLQLAVWADRPMTCNLILAVNVSVQQFKQVGFVEHIAELIRAYCIVPQRLKLELTESVVLNDVSDIVQKMCALKSLGVRLSMDDFGTGYSSLSYLKNLPLDQLKIDQSFVRNIATDENDAVMVKTIIAMAQNFRLNVIAEGVETEAQLAFLKQNGCMCYQGYYFGKPAPIEQFQSQLEALSKTV
ncbi:diguanylate cyclase/phosphodiesterase with PAS/PAC sensor(s) [Gallionella capsiferriformans ES-2]|uniref:Diguanylate cyclase/phosphodiesterase with PAS/PAC sensor(S) n=2 Tax=Gallionella TaxID=96 RepID=D9SHH9_GALCS|nr:diguanylate cyclase/phosphodiesterase with PAS/PAC sensor(s) [Gallionella capsiferriformans ES-2]